MSRPYIDEIAAAIQRHVAPGAAWDGTDERDRALYRIYAVLARAKGERVTLEDVHDAWSAWCAGWVPEHRSLIPFADLHPDVQELDRPYMEAIHAVARELA